jgi:hypothetical protein
MLGIGDGTMVISLKKQAYSPGDTIEGTVALQLLQPKKARELRVEFYGEIYRRRGSRTLTERVFTEERQLYGEKQYGKEEKYAFRIDIPENILKGGGDPYSGLFSRAFSPDPKAWYLHATLDIPYEFDVNQRVEVNIVPKRG